MPFAVILSAAKNPEDAQLASTARTFLSQIINAPFLISRCERLTLMTLRAATVIVTMLLSTLLTTAQQPVAPQTPQFTDPANLRGERVKPHDGRELPIDQGARGLEQMLRKLNTRASLMLIVAHPDDEDGGMLTYYSRGLGARVAVLTLTRGEGGQNAMTGDFEDALGLLAPRNSSPPTAISASTSSSAPRSTSASLKPKKKPSKSGPTSASSTTPSARSASTGHSS